LARAQHARFWEAPRRGAVPGSRRAGAEPRTPERAAGGGLVSLS